MHEGTANEQLYKHIVHTTQWLRSLLVCILLCSIGGYRIRASKVICSIYNNVLELCKATYVLVVVCNVCT